MNKTTIFIGIIVLAALSVLVILQMSTDEKQESNANHQQATINTNSQPTIVNSHCSNEECLILLPKEERPRGVATIQGYFQRVQREVYWNEEVCDGFVITNGPELVMERLQQTSVESDGLTNTSEGLLPVIPLNLSEIEISKQEAIKGSTASLPSTLNVFFLLPSASDAPACWSPIKILDVVQ